MTNSRQKGKRGELEFVHALRDMGIEARRTQQYSGTAGTSDVTSSLSGVHWEVKRRTSIAVVRYWEQAKRDATEGDTPVVALREDRGQWMILVTLDDLPRLAEAIVAVRGT